MRQLNNSPFNKKTPNMFYESKKRIVEGLKTVNKPLD